MFEEHDGYLSTDAGRFEILSNALEAHAKSKVVSGEGRKVVGIINDAGRLVPLMEAFDTVAEQDAWEDACFDSRQPAGWKSEPTDLAKTDHAALRSAAFSARYAAERLVEIADRLERGTDRRYWGRVTDAEIAAVAAMAKAASEACAIGTSHYSDSAVVRQAHTDIEADNNLPPGRMVLNPRQPLPDDDSESPRRN